MEMKPATDGWNPELEGLRSGLLAARANEDKVQKELALVRTNADRRDRLQRRAKRMAEAARDRALSARHLTAEARSKGEAARRKNLPGHRWDAEARRLDAERERDTQDARRWNEDSRRKDREVRSLTKELRVKTEEARLLSEETHEMEQRFEYFSKFGHDPKAAPLTITERTTASLRNVLSGTQHGANQLLRLTIGARGEVVLAFDITRQGDNVVSYRGEPVLLVGPVLPDSLAGKTLDVSEGAGGAQFILSG